MRVSVVLSLPRGVSEAAAPVVVISVYRRGREPSVGLVEVSAEYRVEISDDGGMGIGIYIFCIYAIVSGSMMNCTCDVMTNV